MPAYYTVVSQFNRLRTKQNPRSFFVSTEYRPMHRPILYRYFTDGSPIYCWHTADAIATDCRSISRPKVIQWSIDTSPIQRPMLDRYSPATRPTIDRYSVDTSTEISTVSRPWPDRHTDRYHRSRPPIWHKILNLYYANTSANVF